MSAGCTRFAVTAIPFTVRISYRCRSRRLALYSEVVTKLQGQYADRDLVPIGRLNLHGLDELLNALGEPVFLRQHLPGTDPTDLADVRDRLRDEFETRQVNSVRDARAAARDLALEVQRLVGLNPTVAVLELACGACNGLDEYTYFLTPGQPLDDPTALSGELSAYGLLLNWQGRHLVVDRVVPGSWAAGVGVQPGDGVTHLGKEAVDRLTPEAVIDLLRGDPGAIGDMKIAQNGGAIPRRLTLPGFVPSVVDDRIERDGIGYLRVANFQKTTLQELDSALVRLRSEGMRVLVMDLRGNPGGLFAAAVQMADRFLPAGVIVTTQGQVRAYAKTYLAQNPLAATDVPLVVLVDGDTASAAEVVAAALKENERAVLVGQPTFGKGSIQKLIPLQTGVGLHLTLARFYSPLGQPFAGTGVCAEPARAAPRRHEGRAIRRRPRTGGPDAVDAVGGAPLLL